MTVEIGGHRAANGKRCCPRGEHYAGDECTRVSLFPSCAPETQLIPAKRASANWQEKGF